MNYNKLLKSIFTILILAGTCTASYASIATDAKLQYNKGIDYPYYDSVIGVFSDANYHKFRRNCKTKKNILEN